MNNKTPQQSNPFNPIHKQVIGIRTRVNPPVRITISKARVTQGYKLDSVGGMPTRVLKLTLDEQEPDAHSIITRLQQLTYQFGGMPIVREFAERVLTGQVNNDKMSYVKQLTKFVMDNVIYMADPTGQEYFISPVVMIDKLTHGQTVRGDCDDHVMFLNSLLNSVGFKTRAVGVKLKQKNNFDHVISSVWINNQWLDIDPCAKNVPQPYYAERLVV